MIEVYLRNIQTFIYCGNGEPHTATQLQYSKYDTIEDLFEMVKLFWKTNDFTLMKFDQPLSKWDKHISPIEYKLSNPEVEEINLMKIEQSQEYIIDLGFDESTYLVVKVHNEEDKKPEVDNAQNTDIPNESTNIEEEKIEENHPLDQEMKDENEINSHLETTNIEDLKSKILYYAQMLLDKEYRDTSICSPDGTFKIEIKYCNNEEEKNDLINKVNKDSNKNNEELTKIQVRKID